MQATSVYEMADKFGEPFDQFALPDVGLTHLSVEPQDQSFRRPAGYVYVQRELFLLASELIGDVPAVSVNLKTARSLPDREFMLVQVRRVV